MLFKKKINLKDNKDKYNFLPKKKKTLDKKEQSQQRNWKEICKHHTQKGGSMKYPHIPRGEWEYRDPTQLIKFSANNVPNNNSTNEFICKFVKQGEWSLPILTLINVTWL